MKPLDAEKCDRAFTDEVIKRSGVNVFRCYQCRKCASGCPVRERMDGHPAEVIKQVQLGLKEKAMKDSTIWVCASCLTCSARCPQDIDIAHVIDTVKMMAQDQHVKADTKNVKAFVKIWMTMLKYMGRIYEVGLVGGINVAMKKPFNGIGLAVKMVRNGKLRLLPSIKRSSEMRRMFKRAGKYKE